MTAQVRPRAQCRRRRPSATCRSRPRRARPPGPRPSSSSVRIEPDARNREAVRALSRILRCRAPASPFPPRPADAGRDRRCSRRGDRGARCARSGGRPGESHRAAVASPAAPPRCPGISSGWPSSTSRCVSIVISSLEVKSGLSYGFSCVHRAGRGLSVDADVVPEQQLGRAVRQVACPGVFWEDVERLRGAYEAFNEKGVEAILERLGPDFQVRDRPTSPDRETLYGAEGIKHLFDSYMEAFDALRLEPGGVHRRRRSDRRRRCGSGCAARAAGPRSWDTSHTSGPCGTATVLTTEDLRRQGAARLRRSGPKAACNGQAAMNGALRLVRQVL